MKYQNLSAFQNHLSNSAPHHLCRIYLIQIPDDFERRRAIQAVLEYLPDEAIHLQSANLTASKIIEAVDSPMLIGGDPIVAVDEMDKMGKKELDSFAGWFKNTTIPGYLILASKSKLPFASLVEKDGVVFDLSGEKPWDKEKRLVDMAMHRAKNAGKQLRPDAISVLFERMDKDAALLEQEIDKLICYTGDKMVIDRSDVLKISCLTRSHTIWQRAEEIVWERRGEEKRVDSTFFHSILPVLRSQFQMGLKIATLLSFQLGSKEFAAYFPKVWPKTLEKRKAQAMKLGPAYFQKGLAALFEMELKSRSNSTHFAALFEQFSARLR